MTTIIRQKLGNSKRRLLEKIKVIGDHLNGEKVHLTKYDAAEFLTELEKKTCTFRKHVDELEAASEKK